MNSKILVYFLFPVLWLFISCHASKKSIPDVGSLPVFTFEQWTVDSVIRRIESNKDVKYLTAKGELSYSSEEESIDGKLHLYSVKDSFCLLQIRKLGIELYRILITQDSFHIIDRIDQSYSATSMTNLLTEYQLYLQFSDIHSLLSTGCFLDADLYYELRKEDLKTILAGVSEYQSLEYLLDTLTGLPQHFTAQYPHNKFEIEIGKSKRIANHWIPEKMLLQLSYKELPAMRIQFDWEQIRTDPISELRFVIPEHYKRNSE